MARKRSKKRPRKLPDASGVQFDVEQNAYELFVDFVENEVVPRKVVEDEPDDTSVRAGKKTKSSRLPTFEIDLHGLRLDEAKHFCREKITRYLADAGPRFKVRIITGKGRHSGPEGPVLPSEIHSYIKRQFSLYIETIQESPAEVLLSGVAVRGYFEVTFKAKS